MSINCPHCSKELEGFTTEAVLKQRLEGQGEKYKTREEELRKQLEAQSAAAAKYKADAERLPAIEQELGTIKAERELAEAYNLAGIDPGDKPERLSRYARNLYDEHKAEAGEKAMTFAEFLKAESATDPVLSARRKADPAPTALAQGVNGVKQPAPNAPKVPPVPPRDPSLTGTPPQSGNGQTTIDQIKGMTIRTPQDKEAIQARLRELMHGGT